MEMKERRLAMAYVAMLLFSRLNDVREDQKFNGKNGMVYYLVPKKLASDIKSLNTALQADNEYLRQSGDLTPSFVASAMTMQSEVAFITPESWFETIKSHLYDVWQTGCKLEGMHQRFFFSVVYNYNGTIIEKILYTNADHYDGPLVSDIVMYPLMFKIMNGECVIPIEFV